MLRTVRKRVALGRRQCRTRNHRLSMLQALGQGQGLRRQLGLGLSALWGMGERGARLSLVMWRRQEPQQRIGLPLRHQAWMHLGAARAKRLGQQQQRKPAVMSVWTARHASPRTATDFLLIGSEYRF